ncbi:hypothetical protein [Pseudalgibacter alginicilyticus]|nr:hypothetical protein [Pseudalgibacter alginicilyticus]
MIKSIVIILSMTLNSCFLSMNHGIEMKIINETNQPISKVEFTTTEKIRVIEIDKIEPNDSVTAFLSMKKNKKDGAYSLTFTRANGKKEITTNGYYTNGIALNQWVAFKIEEDTTIVKFDDLIH